MQEASVKMFSLLSLLAVLLLANTPIQSAEGANILGVFTSHSPSHLIVHMSIMKALAEQGHNVTAVTSLKPTVTHDKIRHILIPPADGQMEKLNDQMSTVATQKNNAVNTIMMMFGSFKMLVDMQVDVVSDPRFTALYETPDTKFDLVIIGFFMNDYQLGIAGKFNCPIIVDWTSASMEFTDSYLGNPREVAYVPNPMLHVESAQHMTFIERLKNFFSAIFFRLVRALFDYKMESYYNQLFASDKAMPSYREMKKNVSLVFCNSHFSEGPIRPNVPALIEIGGIQIKDKPDPLPQDISDFLDSSKKNGAILFSLGSNLKSTNINAKTVNTIFKSLASLKQKVIWKWEDLKNTPGSSPNILYKKWLPQDDILAHPNLKLFITHAGKGGVAEAQYHAVPMVAIPVFADQNANSQKLTAAGYGQEVDILNLTEADLTNAVNEVLTNPKYAQKVKEFSRLYRDRPLSAKQSVVFWAEYVIRHHGAAHMQSPLVHLNELQRASIDVIVFVCLALYLVCRLIKLVYKFTKLTFKFICSKLCRSAHGGQGEKKANPKLRKVKNN